MDKTYSLVCTHFTPQSALYMEYCFGYDIIYCTLTYHFLEYTRTISIFFFVYDNRRIMESYIFQCLSPYAYNAFHSSTRLAAAAFNAAIRIAILSVRVYDF